MAPYAPASQPRGAGAARLGKVVPYVGVDYSLPAANYSAVQMPLNVARLPNRYSLYYFPLLLQYANGAGLELRLNTAANYLNSRGAELFILAGGASGEIDCPAKGRGSGIVPGCCPSDIYGGDVTCIAGFPWVAGHSYTLSVSLASKNKSNEEWSAEVIDAGRREPMLVGTWKVPAAWGLLRPTAKAPFGSQVVGPSLPRCDVEPYVRAILSNPVATTSGGKKVTAKIAESYAGPCRSNAVIKASPGDSQADIQMGYAWRPGATPSPSPSPPIGTPLFTPLPAPTGRARHLSDPIKIGKLELVIPGGKYGLVNFPDEQVSMLRFSNGMYRMWVASGAYGYGEDATFLFDSQDLTTLVPVPAALPYAAGVYATWDPGTNRFDANYNGPGTVTPAANGRDLLMIYHGENHFYGGYDYVGGAPGSYFYCAVGLARSSDDGQTWSRAGDVITGAFRKPPKPATGGACNPSVIAVGGYFYAVYIEISPTGGGMAIARSPLSSDAAPGSWKKYYNGSFSTDGLNHGAYTPIDISVGGEPNVTFNRYLNAFVMLIPSQADTKPGTIYWLTSSDLINWSKPRAILKIAGAACNPQDITICYPSLISDGETASQVTDQTGYIYVTHSANGVRGMYRYPYAIGKALLP